MRPVLWNTGLAAVLGLGLQIAPMTPAAAQGVPVVDTQNIAQSIQQLRQMIEDEILQNEQLVQLREQLATLSIPAEASTASRAASSAVVTFTLTAETGIAASVWRSASAFRT